MDPVRLLETARDLLREYGPATAEELAARLADVDVEQPDDPDVLRRFLLGWGDIPGVEDLDEDELPRDSWYDDEAWTALPLDDGRLADLAALLDGLTLTHRLSDDEVAQGALVDDPDLAAVNWLPRDGRTVPLAAGGTATYRPFDGPGPVLEGPDGWLPDAAAVVARLSGGRLELSGLDIVPAPDPATVEAVAATYERVRSEDDPIEVAELVVEVRADHPQLFSTAGAPFGDILEAAGLRSHRYRVLYADEPPPVPGQRHLVAHLREAHGFDDAAVDALLTLFRAVRDGLDIIADPDILDTGASGLDGSADRLAEAAAATLPLLLSRQDHAVALVDDVLGTSHGIAVLLGVMLTTVEQALPDRRARANWHWVMARVGEFLEDDHTVCERHLRRAIDLDPQQAQAIFDLVSYRSLRGEAGPALGLLRQLEGPGYEHLHDLLGRYAEPGPTSAGRNDPCPCGSGRKHKVCCATRNGWPLEDRIEWVWAKLADYLAAPFTAEEVEDMADLIDLDEDAHVLEDLVAANLLLFEAGLLDDFLEQRGALLPADELELLRRWAEASAGAYEVVAVDPDVGTTELLDLVSGDRTTIADRSTTASVEVGERILAWIAPSGRNGEAEPVNGALKVPLRAVDALLESLEDPEALAHWYGRLHAPPVPVTPEGDLIEPTTVTYRVPDPAAAREALATEFDDDGEGGFLVPLPEAAGPDDGLTRMAGGIGLDGDVLTVHAISYARAEAIAEIVEELLPDVDFLDEQVVDLSEMLADARGGDSVLEEGGGGGIDLEALEDEDREQLEAILERSVRGHEDRWVDTPLPALGGATPREAAEDPTRRDDLLRLLAEFDQAAASWTGPGRPMDPDRLRELLGLG